MPLKEESKSYYRDKELLPKGRERKVFVCGPVCMMGVPFHSLKSLSTAPTTWPMSSAENQQLYCQYGESLGPGRKAPHRAF